VDDRDGGGENGLGGHTMMMVVCSVKGGLPGSETSTGGKNESCLGEVDAMERASSSGLEAASRGLPGSHDLDQHWAELADSKGGPTDSN
jgi:hypothetical protein